MTDTEVFIRIKNTVDPEEDLHICSCYSIHIQNIFFPLVDRKYWLQITLLMLDYGPEKLRDNLVVTD